MVAIDQSVLRNTSFLDSFIALCSLIPKGEFPYNTERIHRFWRDNKQALSCWDDLKFDYDGRHPTLREWEDTYQTLLSLQYLFLVPMGKDGTVRVGKECIEHYNRDIKPNLSDEDIGDLEILAERFSNEVSA